MSVETHKETLGFQTEVRQLLDLMIHSLYSNKEIFLRELISNASDASDKLRFEALSDDALYEGDSELKIRVAYDKAARTITLSDNGIGMSRSEVVENIGTIAKSGTRQFLTSLSGEQQKDAKLIGQFGVGFYSAFIVADTVTLVTRRAGLGAEHGVRWTSDGKGEYTLETVEKPTRGTDIILHLREGQDEFLDGLRLRTIIRKYSDHITLPIVMRKENAEGDETVNRAAALWARPRNEIKPEEYDEFYKHVAHDFEAPLAHVHARVEGKHEYIALLYVPQRAPFDLGDREHRHGIKLYVKRVFIMDDAEQLLPPYLRFVRGVIDTSDLPLNISREILQHSRDIEVLRSGATRKVLDLLDELAQKEPEKYATFWKEFGRVLKEGVIEDHANKERLAKLLRVASTHTDQDSQNVALADYVARVGDHWEVFRRAWRAPGIRPADRCLRVGRAHGDIRRGRDPAHQHGSRWHQGRLRFGADQGDLRTGWHPGDRFWRSRRSGAYLRRAHRRQSQRSSRCLDLPLREYSIADCKNYLQSRGVAVRPVR